MKKYLILLLVSCAATFCYAQEETNGNEPPLVKRGEDPNNGIHEKFTVLKSDKSIKQGLFQAVYMGKIVVASGLYDHGEKTGIWRYCDGKGELDQIYDYTNRAVIFSKRPDTANVFFDFAFKAKPADSLTYAVKIGASYGYRFLNNPLSAEARHDMLYYGARDSVYSLVNILTINTTGQLTRWQLSLRGDNNRFQKLYEVPMDEFTAKKMLTAEDMTFKSATLNGQPVESKIYIKMKMELVNQSYYASF